MIDNCHNLELRQMPNSIKIYLLSYHRFYIPQHARICLNHLRNTSLEAIPQNVTQHQNKLNPGFVTEIINMYTTAMEQRSILDLNPRNHRRSPFLDWIEPQSI